MSLQMLQTSEQGAPALVFIHVTTQQQGQQTGANRNKAQEKKKKKTNKLPSQRTIQPLKGLKITEKKVQGSEGTALKSCSS